MDGDEFVLAHTGLYSNDLAGGDGAGGENFIFAVKATDVAVAKQQLLRLSKKVNSSGIDTVNYRNRTIGHIDIFYLMQTLFGPMYSGIKTNYYTTIDDYIVFANSIEAMEKTINAYLYGRTLNKNSNYISFYENISDKANIYLYCNVRKSIDVLLEYLEPSVVNSLQPSLSEMQNIEALGYQMLKGDKMSFSNVCIKYNKNYVEEDNISWEMELDTTLFGKAHIVKDHRDKNNKIVVFDVNKGMYLLDDNGKRVWKIQLPELPLSDVFVIDYYKNGKYQYVFNTKNSIYAIDRNGNTLEGYPISFKEPSTSGMLVLDYANNRNYRYLVACGKQLFNLTKEGVRVEGWRIPQMENVIKKPITYIKEKGLEYLVLTDNAGKMKILNRRGEVRVELKEAILQGQNSRSYIGDFKGVLKFITTNKKGEVLLIQQNGEVDKLHIQEFSDSHYFMFEDIDGDKQNDFVFVEGNKLSVFNQGKESVFDFISKSRIDRRPDVIQRNGALITLVSSTSNELLFINSTGELVENSPLIGSSELLIGQLVKGGQRGVVIGSKSKVINYPVEE